MDEKEEQPAVERGQISEDVYKIAMTLAAAESWPRPSILGSRAALEARMAVGLAMEALARVAGYTDVHLFTRDIVRITRQRARERKNESKPK